MTGSSRRRGAAALLAVALVLTTLAWLPPSAAAADTSWSAPPGTFTEGRSALYLHAEPDAAPAGAAVGLFTRGNSNISVELQSPNDLYVVVDGDSRWTGMVGLPDPVAEGTYTGLDWPGDSTNGRMLWTTGNGCAGIDGWLVIDSITVVGGEVTDLALRFQQQCSLGGPRLRGELRWDGDDTTSPPGPVVPVPAGLWRPDPGSTPATGTYALFDGQPGDNVGGVPVLHTQATAQFLADISHSPHQGVAVSVLDGDTWDLTFKRMDSIAELTVGYYPVHTLTRNPTTPGIGVRFDGQQCTTESGWFAVDDILVVDGDVVRLRVRFEHVCDGGTPWHGEIHLDPDDPTTPPGPVPIPADLWEPAPGSTPATGSYVYLDSAPGDTSLAGVDALITNTNGRVTVARNARAVRVFGRDHLDRFGDFVSPAWFGDLVPGLLYPDVSRTMGDPTRPQMLWGTCVGSVDGWFAVDALEIDGGEIQRLAVRFEQWCGSSTEPLRGALHYDASDTSSPPPPVRPVPDVWSPSDVPPGVTSLVIDSEAGDPLGGGIDQALTAPPLTPRARLSSRRLEISMVDNWVLEFEPMNSIDTVEPGYYPNLRRRGDHNPAIGGLRVTRSGQSSSTCLSSLGWVVIDHIAATGSTVHQVDLRFGLRCTGATGSIHGAFHFDSGTLPPGAPSAPRQVVAVPDDGDGDVAVSWLPPVDAGSTPIVDLVATAAPGGGTCTAVSPATSCTIRGLDPGQATTVTVRARNAAGFGATSLPSLPVTPWVADGYHPVRPVRVLDSRTGLGTARSPWKSGETRNVAVAGVGPVPADASAVVVNLTGVSPSAATHLTMWPAGTDRPATSTLNLPAGDVRANLAVVEVGTSGVIRIQNSSGSVDVVVDVVGWFAPGGSRVHSSAPERIADSRKGTGTPQGALGPGDIRTLTVAGRAGVPTGADAAVVTLTVVDPSAPTHLTVWPSGTTAPTASSVNAPADDTRANLAVVAIGDDGTISVRNNDGHAHIVVDVVGWFDGDGDRYSSVDPTRVLDSRKGTGGYDTPWGAGVTRTVEVAGAGGVPTDATGVYLNLTAVGATADSHVTAWPSGSPRPLASSLNFPAADTRASLVFVRLGPDGAIRLSNNAGTVHLLADVVGFVHE